MAVTPLKAGCAVLMALLAATVSAPVSEARLTNVVTDWINATQGVVATTGIQNQLASKYYGLVGLAAHNAIAAGGAPPAALAAYAGHAVLSATAPYSQGSWDVLLSKQLKAANVTNEDKKAAAAVAIPIAITLFKDRAADQSTRWASFKPAAEGTAFAYQFVPDQKYALYPQLADSIPFVASIKELEAIATNKDQKSGPVFQPPKNDYQQTYELGAKGSKSRKPYDTDSAYFWADGANTSAITGHWIDIAREVLPEDYSLEDTALFFARTSAATYDASVAGWKAKYSTLHWRPLTAFSQGYPGFTADPAWAPLISTPPHPEYPSGHQVSVGAALEVLLRTLGTDNVTFSIGSEGAPWLGNRTYTSLTAAAVEVGDSRLYGGVHFPSANEDGLKLGRLVAGKVFDAVGKKSVLVQSTGTGTGLVTSGAKPAAAAAGAGARPVAASAGGDASKQPSLIVNFGHKVVSLGRRLML